MVLDDTIRPPSTPKLKRLGPARELPCSPSLTIPSSIEDPDARESESPRSTVATKFEHLQLRGAAQRRDSLEPLNGDNPRKKLYKITMPDAERKGSHDVWTDHVPSTELTQQLKPPISSERHIDSREKDFIGQPDEGAGTVNVSEARPNMPLEAVKSLSKRKRSPPPPARQGSPNSDLSDSMTWQDFEITGHEIQDPDDDGEGINGIGFKPTAAIAYARLQKRKQQLQDWRAREAREARQKRSDRRRRDSVESVSTGLEESRRPMVRFA